MSIGVVLSYGEIAYRPASGTRAWVEGEHANTIFQGTDDPWLLLREQRRKLSAAARRLAWLLFCYNISTEFCLRNAAEHI